MNVRQALKEQYHAGLAMLRECVENCPEDLWLAGAFPRTFWRIAFHAVFFTHLYLGQSLDAYEPWPGRPEGWEGLWGEPWEWEPYDLPETFEPYSRGRMLEYIGYVDSLIDPTVDGMDLETEESGIPWYRNISKLSHQMLNIRHVQGHVGQHSELLMLRGIDIRWVSKR